jgi:5,10-methenyltetrahydrofolate synthetase
MDSNSLKTLRQELLKQRAEFAKGESFAKTASSVIAGLNRFLAEYGNHMLSVAFYWPINGELDLRPTMSAWARKVPGRLLALPVARQDHHLDFFQWEEGDALLQSQHGIPEPDPGNLNRPLLRPDCILIPCVGWSSSQVNQKTQYWRLGYGGGYFDRTLAKLRNENPNLICLGVGFNWQKLNDAQWAAQTHDEPLDELLTESGLLR